MRYMFLEKEQVPGDNRCINVAIFLCLCSALSTSCMKRGSGWAPTNSTRSFYARLPMCYQSASLRLPGDAVRVHNGPTNILILGEDEDTLRHMEPPFSMTKRSVIHILSFQEMKRRHIDIQHVCSNDQDHACEEARKQPFFRSKDKG